MWLRVFRILNLAGGLGELWLSLRLAWRLLGDIRVPLINKLVIPLTIAYLIWPLDFLPDFFPFLGQFDDLTTAVVGVLVFARLCPARLVAEHRADLLGRPRPQPDESRGTIIEGQYRVVEEDRQR